VLHKFWAECNPRHRLGQTAARGYQGWRRIPLPQRAKASGVRAQPSSAENDY